MTHSVYVQCCVSSSISCTCVCFTFMCMYMYFSYCQIITSKSFQLNDERAKELTEMAHQGIKLLMSWTTAVMELVRNQYYRGETKYSTSDLFSQYSWKLLHPTNEYDNKDCPKDAEAYERV